MSGYSSDLVLWPDCCNRVDQQWENDPGCQIYCEDEILFFTTKNLKTDEGLTFDSGLFHVNGMTALVGSELLWREMLPTTIMT